MSNYTIALSGLQNTSLAIDTTSNNIANANTVGYKAGEYVFADQFVKAVNPADTARVGMGSHCWFADLCCKAPSQTLQIHWIWPSVVRVCFDCYRALQVLELSMKTIQKIASQILTHPQFITRVMVNLELIKTVTS